MTKQLGNYVQDLRLPKGFMDELRFGRLVSKYGGDGFLAVVLLWRWAAVNQPSTGRLEGMEESDILRVSMVNCERTDFVSDLVRWGFLKRGEDGVFGLPDWVEEQPYVAKAEERSKAGRAAAQKRWDAKAHKGKDKKDAKGNGSAMGTQCPNTNSNTNLKSPLPPQGEGGKEMRR